MMTREEATQKVGKLLRLAQSDNVNEAALAAARAQELMDRFGIERAVADMNAGQKEPDEPIVDFSLKPEAAIEDFGAKSSTWKERLACQIARHNGCHPFLWRRNGSMTLEVAGRPSDVETVRYLYTYVRQAIDALAERDGRGMGITWRNNFRLGCVDTVMKRLHAQRKETFQKAREANAGTALMVVDAQLARFDEKKKEAEEQQRKAWKAAGVTFSARHSGGGARSDFSARQAGRNAAQSIPLGGGKGLASGANRLGGGS